MYSTKTSQTEMFHIFYVVNIAAPELQFAHKFIHCDHFYRLESHKSLRGVCSNVSIGNLRGGGGFIIVPLDLFISFKWNVFLVKFGQCQKTVCQKKKKSVW